MSDIAYDVTCDMAVSKLMSSRKKSLTTHTPSMALASWCSMPTDWPVHRSSRLMMSRSITSGGMPG